MVRYTRVFAPYGDGVLLRSAFGIALSVGNFNISSIVAHLIRPACCQHPCGKGSFITGAVTDYGFFSLVGKTGLGIFFSRRT
ncbi:hypothetical protein [Microcystis aeruginosa]|uniref:hypothetical protein n=1 Tax=Microcystis aeruginosa TaxID=1126 RepID=UPI0012BB16E6|nr:hypothetical protein [Microcystis aeruginosa]